MKAVNNVDNDTLQKTCVFTNCLNPAQTKHLCESHHQWVLKQFGIYRKLREKMGRWYEDNPRSEEDFFNFLTEVRKLGFSLAETGRRLGGLSRQRVHSMFRQGFNKGYVPEYIDPYTDALPESEFLLLYLQPGRKTWEAFHLLKKRYPELKKAEFTAFISKHKKKKRALSTAPHKEELIRLWNSDAPTDEIVDKMGYKNSTSLYSAVCQLRQEGHLVRNRRYVVNHSI